MLNLFKQNKIIIAIAFLLISVLISGSDKKIVRAGIGDNVSGFAWSKNFGWISFNSTDCDIDGDGVFEGAGEVGGPAPTGCPSSGAVTNYGVNIDEATGNFSGYGWSEYAGWVVFTEADIKNDIAYPGCGFPGAPCNAAKYNSGTGAVTGWAKALVLEDDGWVKLSDDSVGAWNGEGVKIDSATGDFSGWAWNDAGGCDAVDPNGSYIEAEDFTGIINDVGDIGEYIFENTQSPFFGTGYLKASNPGNAGPSYPDPPYDGTLVLECASDYYAGREYEVNFTETGAYYLWTRVYGRIGDRDSIHIGLDGECVAVYNHYINGEYVSEEWIWANNPKDLIPPYDNNSITINSTGLHKINIWVRENNQLVDGIYLSKNPANPTDESHGTNISPRETCNNKAGIGWISFNCSDTGSCGTSAYKVHTEISPTAPTNLTASPLSCNSMQLSWTDNSDNETGFETQYCTSGCTLDINWTKHLPNLVSNTTSRTIVQNENTAYYFRVRALGAGGNSAWEPISGGVQGSTDYCPPVLSVNNYNCDSVVLNWTYGDNSSVTEYEIWRDVNNSGSFAKIATTIPDSPQPTTYADNNILSDTLYDYYVIAQPQNSQSDTQNDIRPCPKLPKWKEVKPN
jgi:hypothetical protein